MDEHEWNVIAYAWGKLLEISWYHAHADIRQLRQNLGDEGAMAFIQIRINSEEVCK